MARRDEWIRVDEIAPDIPLGRPKRRLVASMRKVGQTRLVHVRRREDGTYEVVLGHQYAAAARLIGLKTLDVVVEDGPDAADSADRKRLAGSAQIETIDQLYIARCLARLLAKGGVTQAELARDFDISRAHVSHLLRVLDCPDLVAMFEEEDLAFGAAKAMAGLGPEERKALRCELRAHKAVHDRFPSVEQIAHMVAQRQGDKSIRAIPRPCIAAVVAEIEARGRAVVAEVRGARRKQVRVTLSVEPEDLAWLGELIGRKPDAGSAREAAA